MKVLNNRWDIFELKANECNYKQHDRELKSKFINGINDEMITAEMIRVNHNEQKQ